MLVCVNIGRYFDLLYFLKENVSKIGGILYMIYYANHLPVLTHLAAGPPIPLHSENFVPLVTEYSGIGGPVAKCVKNGRWFA